MKGGEEKGLDLKKLEKIWTDWEAFASYAFNKSHSTCYAFVAYQTAYLKAHYAAEYMSAVLTSSLGNIEKITFFMEECKNLGIKVLGPDINQSDRQFNATGIGEIRFGLAGVKGSGDAAVESIIEERDANGPFKDIFDFITRVNLRTVNKKTLESLAYAGGFDCFEEYHRAQYFTSEPGGDIGTFIERLIRYANNYHAEKASAQASLFGAFGGNEALMVKPKAADVQPWDDLAKLRYEQEVVGFYISGHPLDTFRIELDNFCNGTLDELMVIPEGERAPKHFGKDISVGGIVTSVMERMSKNGNPFIIFKIEDYKGSIEMLLGGEDCVKFKNYLEIGRFLYIKGKIQNRWKQEDQFEFKISAIQLLTEIRDKMCRKIKVNLTLDQIDAEFIALLRETFSNNPGQCPVNMTVKDPETHLEVEMALRNYRVSPTNELFKTLKGFPGVDFSLN